MITIGGRLVKDLLENPRIIRDGELNRIWLLRVGDQFIIVSENNETKEQIWSDLIEVNNIMNLGFSIELPVEKITTEFLVDLVGNNLVVLCLGDDKEKDYWVTRLHVEEPIIERYENSSELVSYESICYEEGKRKHCYESLNDEPHALGYLNDLMSIDLPSEEQTRTYKKVLKKKN
jgi:hypothetical protein